MSRCHPPGGLTPADAAEVARFRAYLADPDPDRDAAYARHYPEETHDERDKDHRA